MYDKVVYNAWARMKATRAEKRIQKDFREGKFREVALSKKERKEIQEAAAGTLRQLKRLEAFKRIREHLGLSQAGMAAALQVSKRTVESWEGRRREIPEPMMVLAELLRDLPAVRKRLLAA